MCIAGFAGTEHNGPTPTWAIGMIGAPSAWRAQGPRAYRPLALFIINVKKTQGTAQGPRAYRPLALFIINVKKTQGTT